MSRLIKLGLWLICLFMTACYPAVPQPTLSVTSTRTPWPTRTRTATEVPPTATLTPTITPIYPTPTQSYIFTALDTSTWLEYANPKYNFAFYYPSDWELTLDEDEDSPTYLHLIRIQPDTKNPAAAVFIGFKGLDEYFDINRPAESSGELVINGEIRVMGTMITRQLLVFEKQHISVFYNGAAELRRNELVLTLSLDSLGNNTGALSMEQENIADQIMASLRWIEEPTATPTITPTITPTSPHTATPTRDPSITVTVTPTLDPSITVTVTPTVTNTTSAYP